MKALDEIDLAKRDRLAIERAARILRRDYPVKAIVLFGSKTRGDDDPESDIDLLILTSRPVTRAEHEQMTKALFPIQLDLGVVISKLIVCADDWERGIHQALPIRAEIDREGAAV